MDIIPRGKGLFGACKPRGYDLIFLRNENDDSVGAQVMGIVKPI
jgi:hypothetical protein